MARILPCLAQRIPSHDTFARLSARLDSAAFEVSFQQWMAALIPSLEAQVIATDGKILNGFYDLEGGVKALQLVSA